MDSSSPTQHQVSGTESLHPLFVLLRNIRKHWPIVLCTAIAVTLAATFYTLGQTKVFRAVSTLQLDPNPPRPLGKNMDTVVDIGTGQYWNNREYFETQYKVLQSMRVAAAVVRDLDLQHDAAFLANVPANSARADVSVEDAADVLRARLKVDPVKESRLAVVSFDDASPERAQRVLSAVIDTYMEQHLNDALESTTSAVDWLRGQLGNLRTDLEASEMALHEYKLQKNMLSVAFDDQSNMLREQMKQLNEALTTVRAREQEVAARRAELAKVPADNPINLPASELLNSQLLQQLRQRHEEAIRDRDALLGSGKGAKHPDVEAANQRVEATRKALLAEVRNVQGALDRDLAVVHRQEGGLSGLFDGAKKQALDLNILEIEYNRLLRQKENAEKMYSLILERTKESDLARMMRVNNIRVIDRPLALRRAVSPRAAINITLGIFVGLGLGVLAAMLRAALDRSLKTPDDVEQELGLTFLGLLPTTEAAAKPSYYRRKHAPRPDANGTGPRELMVFREPTSGFAEAARAVRTNIMFTAPDHPYKTLLVTSAGPREGKTTVSCCVAIAMAQAGQRVVLLDADLRRPRVHRIFGKGSDAGLSSALLDEPWTNCLYETEVPNLSVMPAGPPPPNPAELFHSERFRALLRELTQHFDRVIIDSPPVVAVTDAAILSTLCDGTVLVVRAYETSRELARQARRTLQDVGCKTAGAVLNAVDLDRHEYKYYHYYYRRDDYYVRDRETAAPHGETRSAAARPPHISR